MIVDRWSTNDHQFSDHPSLSTIIWNDFDLVQILLLPTILIMLWSSCLVFLLLETGLVTASGQEVLTNDSLILISIIFGYFSSFIWVLRVCGVTGIITAAYFRSLVPHLYLSLFSETAVKILVLPPSPITKMCQTVVASQEYKDYFCGIRSWTCHESYTLFLNVSIIWLSAKTYENLFAKPIIFTRLACTLMHNYLSFFPYTHCLNTS